MPAAPIPSKAARRQERRFAWTGTLGTDPLRSSGTFELGSLRLPKYAPYYAPQVNFELKKGLATLKAAYDFEWSTARHSMKLGHGSLELRELAFHEKGGQDPAILLPAVQVTGIEGDLLGDRLDIASVAVQDGRLLATRTAESGLNLSRLFASGARTPPSKPFQLGIHELALGNCAVQLEDRVPTRPVQLNLDRVEASLKDLNLEPGHSSPLELSLRFGQKATLRAKGVVAPLKPSGELELKLEGLDLPLLDTYLEPFANLRFSRGTLGLAGRLRFSLEGRKDDGFGYRGDVQIADFEARDSLQNEPFLRWKRLHLGGLDASSQRPAVTLKAVDWTDPEARLVMAQNGVSNVARALNARDARDPSPPWCPLHRDPNR